MANASSDQEKSFRGKVSDELILGVKREEAGLDFLAILIL